MKRGVSVVFPTWPTDRLRLKGFVGAPDKPFVTIMRDGTRRVIAAVNRAAAKARLYPGHTLAYARALFPDLEVAEADPVADREGLKQSAFAFLKRYSPLVAMPFDDALWLDITGCAHLYGGEQGLLEDMIAHLEARNICAKACVADTFACADAVALCAPKPITIVPEKGQKEFLGGLPVAALRLPEGMVWGLEKLGFTKLRQLYEMPRAPLAKRFGKELLVKLDQALGDCGEAFDGMERFEIPRVKCAFTEPAANPDFIAQAIEQLAVKLCEKLRESGVGARHLDLIFHRVDNTKQALRVGTVRASQEPPHMMRLFKEHFDKVDYGFGVESLALSAPLTENVVSKQLANACGTPEVADLSSLVDILHNRLGPGHVFQTKAVESDVPERSVKRIAPLSDGKIGTWPETLPRPARLLRHPEKIEAMALLPDHAPVQFVWRHKRHRVTRADGPERLFGEWWNREAESMAVRDYFQVEDEKGARFWLFRRGDGFDARTGSHEWFIHGFFG